MQLHFRQYGEGQPMIIIHGLYGISDNWVNHARILAENFKVYIPDMRNHGQSGHSNFFNYEVMAEDITEFIEQHEIENPIIMGHSMGGKIAMKFALDNPDLVQKLIVIDMSMRQYNLRAFHSKIINAMLDIDFNTVKSRKEVDDYLAKTIEDARIRLFVMKNLYWTERKTLSWRLNLKAIIDNIDAIFEGINSNQKFTKPSLFIRGEKSDYIRDEDFDLIKKQFTNSELKTIPNAGHWVQADEPELFIKFLKDFLIAKS
jgi:pimeloyl-ACP methyl ester carboxylesterase